MKGYLTIIDGITEIDTTVYKGENSGILTRIIENAILEFSASYEFAYTLYDSPHGIQVPIESRRGKIADIVADRVSIC
jgi:hypothetical protein